MTPATGKSRIMQKIYATGECILDIAFREGQPFFTGPGGSRLNTAVSLGRTGLPVFLISDCSDDPVGISIRYFLKKNGVSTEFIRRYRGQIRVAFAFLDDRNNAEYTFYPEVHLSDTEEIQEPDFRQDDIFLYGSFYSLKSSTRPRLEKLLEEAGCHECIRVYDPNFRKPHLRDLDAVMPYIHENIRLADITRGSDEDFGNIFRTDEPDCMYDSVKASGGDIMILTQGGGEVLLYTQKMRKSYPVPLIQTVSTIGAGDNFNAGLIYELAHNRISRRELPDLGENLWDKLIHRAIDFASHVCCEKNNYISHAFASRLISFETERENSAGI